VYEKVYLAILLAVQQWRQYLQHGEFLIKTDNKSLTHLIDQGLHTECQQKALTKMMGLQYHIVYKKGHQQWCYRCPVTQTNDPENLCSVTEVHPVWLQRVITSYHQDTVMQRLLQQLTVNPASDNSYTVRSGILCHHNRILVGADPNCKLRSF
jgi:hypothetical protein